MSRGLLRTALARRLETFVEYWKLPYSGAIDGDMRAPSICEQYAPVANEEETDAPLVRVWVDDVVQTGSDRVAEVKIAALAWNDDAEQVYRDAENLIEAIEIDLVANPWLDGGRFELMGPWKTTTTGAFPLGMAELSCRAKMPPLPGALVGPKGESMEL